MGSAMNRSNHTVESSKLSSRGWSDRKAERAALKVIQEWFGHKYRAIGVVCGAVSGNLGAIDFDAEQRCEWWRTTHPDLAQRLPTEKTTRGLHVYFQCEPVGTQRPKNQHVELLSKGAYVIVTPSPGKTWLNAPNGQLPRIDPFALGLEIFGIAKSESKLPEFTEATEDTEAIEALEETQEIACASSPSSVNSTLRDEVQKKLADAITKTLPTDVGQRDRCIFTFCQWLKAIPEMRNRSAGQLKPVVEKWHAAAYPVIGTKSFEVTWQDFVHAWKNVKWAKGMLFDAAVQKAREDTLNPPEATDYGDPRTQLLVRLAWQLQRVHGEQPFYLSLRMAGQVLDLSHTEAGKRLEMLMADEKLAIVAPHKNIFATRYRYIGRSSREVTL